MTIVIWQGQEISSLCLHSFNMFPMRYLSVSSILIILLLNCLSCRTTGLSQDAGNPVNEIVAAPAPVLISRDSSNACYRGLNRRSSVVEFYESREGRPFWVVDTATTSLADSMIMFIRGVAYYGLVPSDYHLEQITNAVEKELVANELAVIDVWLTDAFFAIASDLGSSRASRKDMTNDSLDIDLLNSVVKCRDVRRILETKEPSQAGYTALKEVLRISLDSLSDYVKSDSDLLTRKIRSIKINLDRWRGESVSFADRYVYINIPSFILHVVENDSIVFSSRVIVGATETPTPEITSVIECFTIYPYWHVPRKIAVNEYLPIIQRDTAFISRNNFDILDRKGKILNPDSINWLKFHKNYFPVVLRQREGEENSLGIIKFLFDNPYAVYLHDTNAKRLFKSTRRSFSHGCIRMERAIDLAHFLVTGSLTKSSVVERLLSKKQRSTIDLNISIPIYIRYFTAEVTNGAFRQYDDIYGMDVVIDESMTKAGDGAQK